MNKEIRELMSATCSTQLECAVQLYIAGEHTNVRQIITGVAIISGHDASKLVQHVKRNAAIRQHLFAVQVQESLDALFTDSTSIDTKEGE